MKYENYKGLSDYEIIEMVRKGDSEAMEHLYLKHKKTIVELSYDYFLSNHSREDIVQILSLGFIKAVNKCDTSYTSPFIAYAIKCMRNEINDHIRSVNANKNSGPTEYLYSQVKPNSDSELRYIDTINGDTDNPEQRTLFNDIKNAFKMELIKLNISEDVLFLLEEGKNYAEIARDLYIDKNRLYYKISKIKKNFKKDKYN